MRELFDAFFRHYLAERNLEATLSLLTENVISIGTGEEEIGCNKAELRMLLEREFAVLTNPLQYEILTYVETPIIGNACNIFATMRVRVDNGEGVFEMYPRMTCSCVEEGGAWKIACLHMSTPTKEQEEDTFFPLRFGTDTMGTITTDSSTKLMELVSKTLPGGIMGGFLEEGYPLYVINDRMLKILGYSYEELIAETGEMMINIIHPDDRQRIAESIEHQFAQKNEYQVEYRAIGKGGRVIWVSDIGKKIVSETGRDAMISIMTDISERIEWEKQLIRDAEHDDLTSLYNRKKAIQLIDRELERNGGGTLFICDVDNFKSVNDTRGHVTGDLVLVRLATIIRRQNHASVAARIGGDEYALFFPASVEKQQAVEMMQDIQREFVEDMQSLLPELNVSLSVGGKVCDGDEDCRALYKMADAALYRSKKNKGNLVLE